MLCRAGWVHDRVAGLKGGSKASKLRVALGLVRGGRRLRGVQPVSLCLIV